MRALVLNDTRRGSFSRHIGCAAVMEHLLHLCATHGIDVGRTFKEPERLDSQEFVEALHDAQIVIVNGEGTMHHDTRVALILARAIVFAKGHGKATALVNAVWQANRVVNGCLQSLDYVCARDSHSAAQMREAGLPEPDVAPDLSFYRMPGEGEPLPGTRGSAVLVIDSVDAEFSERLYAFASARRLEFRVMQDWRQRPGGGALPFAGSAHVSLEELRSAGVVITGRFHAVCLAMKYGVPFLTARSNTHKIEALLHDAGLPVDEFILPPGWQQLGAVELAERALQAHARHAPAIATTPALALLPPLLLLAAGTEPKWGDGADGAGRLSDGATSMAAVGARPRSATSARSATAKTASASFFTSSRCAGWRCSSSWRCASCRRCRRCTPWPRRPSSSPSRRRSRRGRCVRRRRCCRPARHPS